jgi:hypothetical protein
MINPARRIQISRAVLEALSMAGSYALEESRLFSFVDDLVAPPLQYTEQGLTTKFLKDQGWIREAPNSMDPGLKQWVITESGRNQLASL